MLNNFRIQKSQKMEIFGNLTFSDVFPFNPLSPQTQNPDLPKKRSPFFDLHLRNLKLKIYLLKNIKFISKFLKYKFY